MLVVLSVSVWASGAEGFRFESAGARFGFGVSPVTHNFHQAEAVVMWTLPAGWDLGREWRLQTLLEASAGWLGDPGGNGFIGTLGPSLSLGRARLPVSIEAGLAPTFLSTHEFGTKDFGALLQFTSQVGLDLDLGRHFRFSYRFQHMSNGGFSSPNPGLNLNVVGLSYRF